MKSKGADLLAREDTSEKVEHDQYTVFGEQRHLDDLNYSVNSIRGESCLKVDPSQLATVYNREMCVHATSNAWLYTPLTASDQSVSRLIVSCSNCGCVVDPWHFSCCY